MLTHTLRQNFYAEWAVPWVEEHLHSLLKEQPSAVSVDEVGDLVLECENVNTDSVLVSPGLLMDLLQQSAPTATTLCCCWHLCREYDDWQETSAAVAAATSRRLEVELAEPTLWYWDDWHGALITTTQVTGTPAVVENIRTKEIRKAREGEEDEVSTIIVLLPDQGLQEALTAHLEARAFHSKQEPQQ